MSTDKAAAAIRELVERWMGKKHPITMRSYVSDLTALISEHYTANEEVDKMVSERLKEYHLNEGYDVVIVGNPDKEIPGDIFEDIKVAALELGELRGLKVMITGFTANYLKTRDNHESV